MKTVDTNNTIFGFTIVSKKSEYEKYKHISTPENDGAFTIYSSSGGGSFYGLSVIFDIEGKTENDNIDKYRELALIPEVDSAVDDIINEAIIHDGNSNPVDINVDKIEEKKVQELVKNEFEYLYSLLDFNNLSYDLFRKWYIDGRVRIHKIIDSDKPKEGIQKLVYIDPKKLKKVREVVKEKDQETGAEKIKEIKEYFLYKDIIDAGTSGINRGSQTYARELKISTDSICEVNSGLMNETRTQYLSYLHKSIKPYNQLRMVEDALVIYRIARAPERRVFYIDVGEMPTNKAEEYVANLMRNHQTKITYDAVTGEVRDDKRFSTMLEDFWMPRREGGKGTEISTLSGGQNLGDIEDVQYFQAKFYKSLNIPISRLSSDTAFNMGRTSEITRDEVKFGKFIARLQEKFSYLFEDLLKFQLILKGIVGSVDEWEEIREKISFTWQQESFFTELKENEILGEKIDTLDRISNYVGNYYSKNWVRKNILKMSDDDIEVINKEIEEEKKNNEIDDDDDGGSSRGGGRDGLGRF